MPEELTHQLSIRLTDFEREAIGRLAAAERRSLSSYIVQVVLKWTIPSGVDDAANRSSDNLPEKTRQLGVRMTQSDREEIRKRATGDGRSFSGYIVEVLKRHLERTEAKRAETNPQADTPCAIQSTIDDVR